MKKYAKQDAFVLPLLLIFLPILSLMGIVGLTNTSETLKSLVHAQQRWTFMLQAKQIANYLENGIIAGNRSCLIPTMAAVEFAQKSLSWWQHYACGGNLYQIRYYYVLEFLGNDPCGIILKNDNHLSTANFYRMTLFVLPEKAYESKIRLQRTLAIASDATDVCHERQHRVTMGYQMQREI